MPHQPTLIATVAMAFVVAFAFGFAADRLRLPPLVGYLVAGIMVGPFTGGFVADAELSGQLAEMGVILLMFGVGLHFSVADLAAVRWIAVPGALAQITIVALLGIGLATAWGWTFGSGLVFGLSLSVASTVVLLRALEEHNSLETPNGRIAVGWLIVEDLTMVVALVVLPALAEALGGSAGEAHPTLATGDLLASLALTVGKVVAFVGLAMFLGPRIVPWILGQVARTGSRELFTLSVLALALGIAYGSAEIFGVSFALGAFFAGVVLSESRFSHRAAADSLPLQDAFAVLFFVSVGMLFDPSILWRDPLSVLLVAILILFGKSLVALLIVLALRFPLSTAVMVSANLAQIGEFSFILAGLGISVGLLGADARDLVLAGAIVSITLNPLAIHAAERLNKRVAASGERIKGYGAPRFTALVEALGVVRERGEAREAARAIREQELLQRFPIFTAIDPEKREEFLLLFRPLTAAPGQRIIRKGDRPDGVYFVSTGSVEVSVGGQKIRLGPGDFFGEMALLSGARRSADVTAVDYCQLLVMTVRDFQLFIARNPALHAVLDRFAEERSAMNRRLGDAAAVAGDGG